MVPARVPDKFWPVPNKEQGINHFNIQRMRFLFFQRKMNYPSIGKTPLILHPFNFGLPFWFWTPLNFGPLWFWTALIVDPFDSGHDWFCTPLILDPFDFAPLYWFWTPFNFGPLWFWDPLILGPFGKACIYVEPIITSVNYPHLLHWHFFFCLLRCSVTMVSCCEQWLNVELRICEQNNKWTQRKKEERGRLSGAFWWSSDALEWRMKNTLLILAKK